MVTDEGLCCLLSSQKLHRLCVSGSSALTPIGVAEALQCGGRQLLDLDLRDCGQLTRVVTTTLRRTCALIAPHLVSFNHRLLHGSKSSVEHTLMLDEGVVHRRQWSNMAERRCSLRRTGHIPVMQPLYHCLTCAIVGHAALCSACALLCHQARGHSIVFYCNASGTCDCAVQSMPSNTSDKRQSCVCLWQPEEI